MIPAIELLSDSVEPNPLASAFPGFSYCSLLRVYSIEGLRPVRVRISNKPDGQPWAAQVDVMGDNGKWNVMLFNRAVAPQDGYGEDEADRLAALAARLQSEARR